MADAPSFDWDPVKDRINRSKHGVSFERAQYAFFDPRRIIAEDLDHSGAEPRYFCFGDGGWWRNDGAVHMAQRRHSHLRRGLLAQRKENL